MKILNKSIIYIGLCALFFIACEEYLDKAPEAGLTQEEVFSKYENFLLFFDAVYNGNSNVLLAARGRSGNIKSAFYSIFNRRGSKNTWETCTDFCDQGRSSWQMFYKRGPLGELVDRHIVPFGFHMFQAIRVCNISLENINNLKDAQQQDMDDLKAQAYFVRGFAHFYLFKLFGSMPYISKALTGDDQWDIPRLTKHETLTHIAADMDTAAFYFEKAGRMRRDPGPGQAGHLNSPDQWRPNGVTAKAMKARALLYAASPLNNEFGIKDWEEAAKANWEAIQVAEQYGYALLSAADYKKNVIGTTYSNEQLWGYYLGKMNYNSVALQATIPGIFAANKTAFCTDCPTQNAVDMFETRWGDPLNTQADREAAITAGNYNEQDPYQNRDPRFYIDIIYNTATIPGYITAKLFYEMIGGKPNYSELLDQTYLGVTHTGYYNRKIWGEQSTKNRTSVDYTEPIIRLGELYLNYAEAANEAYGPNTPAPNSNMTAVQAINVIRARIGMVNVLPQFTVTKEVFRPRIKNERNIELAFEGHYFFDIRRWKDAPAIMQGLIYGMDIEKVPVSTTYPTGYKYNRLPLPANRQPAWKDAMYYFPFNVSDNFLYKNFILNELW